MTETPAGGVAAPAAAMPWTQYTDRRRFGLLAVLFLVSTSSYLDRNVISVLLEPIKHEFGVSDTMLGLLGGAAFAIFYATLGLPVARWADQGNRRTIITLALTVWSVMTALCGLAQGFWQLALARVGVGAGESGAMPPAQSLLADYFPPERRATAIGIFTSSAMFGYLIGFIGGGYVAAHYGWRMAFLLAGLPGLLLAVLCRLLVDEPRERLGYPRAGAGLEPMRTSIARLFAKRSYRSAVIGLTLYFFVAYGALIFIPSFLVRVRGIALADVGAAYGGISLVSSLIGTLGGGWLADRLSKRDPRWLAWLPALGCATAAPIYAAALQADNFNAFLAWGFVAGILVGGGLPPVFSAVHVVCGSARRALAFALLFFAANLFGGGIGPVLTGALSDALSARQGVEGLRTALTAAMGVLVLTGLMFYRFGRQMQEDHEP